MAFFIEAGKVGLITRIAQSASRRLWLLVIASGLDFCIVPESAGPVAGD